MRRILVFFLGVALVSCGGGEKKESTGFVKVEFPGLYNQARTFFAPLPATAENEANPGTAAKIKLGYTLYYDNRLSKEGNISCNSCHNLATYGVDNLPTSPGDDGTLGDRNSPTVLNSALHMAQFWDGREPDVEAQAGGPVLNPVEMAMPDEAFVVNRLQGIEGYKTLFKEAFPEEEKPITYNNMKMAIGAFERELLTPSKFDQYLSGDKTALSSAEQKGMKTFIDQGCISCHMTSLIGGNMYQKTGVYASYAETVGAEKDDLGRYEVTESEADKYLFKVPSLRNVEKTAPYFHDGAVESLSEAIKVMCKIQLNKDITDEQAKEIETFLASLTGEVPEEYTIAPALPE
jgi:cytochrome c peroxidase